MDFPYGKAPLAILILSILSGGFIFVNSLGIQSERPDLIFVTFTKEHAAAYRAALPEFERANGCKVQLQLVDQRALEGRLQASLQVGAEVPDMVELLDGRLGVFTRGPLEDVGFLDLTERVRADGLRDQLVAARFAKWTDRGRLFALPHDVHPVMLAYRRDLVEALGIDVTKLTTWDEFTRVGREVVTKDLNGDGVPDRYMIDLPADGGDALRLLVNQRGGALFDDAGEVAFDSELVADTVAWYVRQFQGKDRIAFPAGWGQNLAKAMNDGLVLFYLCPDWRSKQFEKDVPGLAGKMALMPLPAWRPGERRTSSWGGTGLAITKPCKRPELAWKLAMYLYYQPAALGERFADTGVLPPLKAAWSEPAFREPKPFYGGMALGQAYAALADSVPSEKSSAYLTRALAKLNEAFQNALIYQSNHGDDGLLDFTRGELKRVADQMRVVIKHNRFLDNADERPVSGLPLPVLGERGTRSSSKEAFTTTDACPSPPPSPRLQGEGVRHSRDRAGGGA